jgi:hypothetical protein
MATIGMRAQIPESRDPSDRYPVSGKAEVDALQQAVTNNT